MADSESFSEDISTLWGDTEQDALEPPRPNGSVSNGQESSPAATNGGHAEVEADDPRDDVARLANALAGHQVGVVRRAELAAMRTDMEDAFTQKLAVAIYELLSASNERFSSVEGHMDRRLQDVVAELNQCIRSQGDRLAAAIETQQQITADIARSSRDELTEISDRFRGPVEALAAFQRELRHEVGRVGDLVAAHNAEALRRSEEAADAGAAMAERLRNSETRDAATTESVESISERVASIQSDVNDVHEAIQALREEVSNLRQRPGVRGRWRRSG